MKKPVTVSHVDLKRYLTRWYVIAGRTTFLENDAYNSIEQYQWNEEKKRIDIDFQLRKGSFDGKLKSIPQKGWIEDKKSNAHWKVQFIWPIKADYLILALDPDYLWTAVGVSSQRYLWIMSTKPQMEQSLVDQILAKVSAQGYAVQDVKRVPQKW